MAFTKLSDYSYICLSTDEKDTDEIIVGARCYEYDSDTEYLFDGTAWRRLDRTTIEWEHHRIHAGKMWLASAVYSAVANLGFLDLVISVGASGLHTVFRDFVSGESSILIYEGADVSGGQTVTPRNANRITGDESPPFTAVQSDGSPALTVNSAGTLVELWYNLGVGTATPGRAGEIILAPSTVYLCRIWNGSGEAVNGSWNIRGYTL